jgi:hypothetical protein
MPLLSRFSIRLSLLYLLLGMLGLTVYWADLAWSLSGTWYALRPASLHLITVGWLTQLIFAVIFWMFPIVTRDQPRGHERIAWVGFVCLNLGIVLRLIFELGMSWGWPSDVGWGLVLSALLQWIGATAWVINVWDRIRARGGR